MWILQFLKKGNDSMFDSRVIANRFLDLAAENNQTLTLMQVLKLVYIAHGFSLAINGASLIKDPVEAWQYGPVIRKVYDAFRRFGGQPVTSKAILPPFTNDKLEEREDELLKAVFERYGKLSGYQLSAMTHKDGTPWQLTWDGTFGKPISTNLINEHYQSLLKKVEAA